MAKRNEARKGNAGSSSTGTSAEPGGVEQRVLEYAETLGRFLGTAQVKTTTWLAQREDVTQQLVQIRDSANSLLAQLGEQVQHGYEAVSAAVTPARRRAGAKKAAASRRAAAKGRPAPPGTGEADAHGRVAVKKNSGGLPAAEKIRRTTKPPASRAGSRGGGGAGRRGNRG